MNTPLANEVLVVKPRKIWKVWLKTLTFGVVAFLTLLFLVVAFENWRGKRLWETYRAEAAARGVKTDLASIISPPIPDSSNVAAIPILAALLNYDYDPKDHHVRWRDTNTFNRVMALQNFVGDGDGLIKGVAKPGWDKATPVDLQKMEENLIKLSNKFSSVTKQASPAQTLLSALAEFDAELKSIEVGFTRPQVRFPLHYEEAFNCLLPHLAVFKGLSRFGQYKSAAFLAEHKTTEAFNQVLFSLRCGEVVGVEPILISSLVQLAVDSQSISAIYEGIITHQWNAVQLLRFEAELGSRDPFTSMSDAIRFERGFANESYRLWRDGSSLRDLDEFSGFEFVGWAPKAVLYQNQLRQNWYFDGLDLEVVRTHGLSASLEDLRLDKLRTGFYPYHALAAMLTPALENAVKKVARGRVTLDLAILACELERYRLAKGSYPETLVALVPDFAKGIPRDAASMGELHYRREADDRFMLYSVGSDLKDDQGKMEKGEKGDWVWRWPTAGK